MSELHETANPDGATIGETLLSRADKQRVHAVGPMLPAWLYKFVRFKRFRDVQLGVLRRQTRHLCLYLPLGLLAAVMASCAAPLSPSRTEQQSDAMAVEAPALSKATPDSSRQEGLSQTQPSILQMSVIAHSVPTSMEARDIMRRQGWIETQLRRADGILVVVRSMLLFPLQPYYKKIGDLDRDAEMQLNISGENFHVYIYAIGDDLSATQLRHVHYPASDF